MAEPVDSSPTCFDEDSLPEPLPGSPMELFCAWFAGARAAQQTPNPDAIALATSDAQGNPSVRMVLCKRLDPSGYLVFYTNRNSRKGRELAHRARCAGVLHLDAFGRQVRFEGLAVPSPASESDAYFASRSLMSRIGAWASAQSEAIGSREELLERVGEVMARFDIGPQDLLEETGVEIPRPEFWGGFRVWFDRVELWIGGDGRIHDRAVWNRTLMGDDSPGLWDATRLQP